MTSPSASQVVRAVLPDAAELRQQFEAAGQAHVFRHFDDLSNRNRERLLESARAIDLDVVERLAAGRGLAEENPSPEPLGDELIRFEELDGDLARRADAVDAGRELLSQGKIACITVAGGQGTRLGFGLPKGAFPIGPGSRTLFDIHARGVADASQAAGRPVPWVIVVSEATAAMTRVYLEEHGLPGVDRSAVRLAVQGSFPCLDDDAKLMLATRDRIAPSPDGHGGALRALRTSGA
ncbi:MAG: UTP--glucose-1-phosphate uridylyltransferase, partial [Planctomycetota bacterium]